MQDLQASVTTFTVGSAIAVSVTVNFFALIVIIDDDSLSENFFKIFGVVFVFTTPFDQFCERHWLDDLTSFFPGDQLEQLVIIGVGMPDTGNCSQLHLSRK